MGEYIIGLDEVGRGSIAGPMVVVAAAFSDAEPPVSGLDDSKKLNEETREELSYRIAPACPWFKLGWVEPWEIDRMGMNQSWQLACTRALDKAPEGFLLVDGDTKVKSWKYDQETVIKGDSKEWQISAASILAKHLRDQEMIYLHEFWPHYRWVSNKGYNTKDHIQGIEEHGICREHRELFLRKMRAKSNRFLTTQR